MRVDAALELDPAEQLELPWQSATGHYFDLRSNARSIYQIAPARLHPPLGRFLATVNSDDSVFATAACQTRFAEAGGNAAGRHQFSSRVALVFVREDFNFEQSHYQGLIGQLERLLVADSSDEALAARLRIGTCRFTQLRREGFHLTISLEAQGDTPEQAQLRWGLGLVQVQQALLYLSRVVRQHLPERARS